MQKKAAKKVVKKTEGVVELGKEIRQTNQIYMSLKALGELDEKGRSIFSLGYSGKITAPPDRGLLLLVLLLEEIKQFMNYSSIEAAEYDLEMLKNHINSLEYKKKESADAKRDNSDGV